MAVVATAMTCSAGCWQGIAVVFRRVSLSTLGRLPRSPNGRGTGAPSYLEEEILAVSHKEPVGVHLSLLGIHLVKAIVIKLANKALIVTVLKEMWQNFARQFFGIPCRIK